MSSGFIASIAIFVAVSLVWWLLIRIGDAERRLDRLERAPSVDGEEFLDRLREYERSRNPRLRKALDSREAAHELALTVASERPALKRVFEFGMRMSRDFVRDVVGIFENELESFKNRLSATDLCLPSMTLEEWNTHTVVINGESGTRLTEYDELGLGYDLPYVLWMQRFGHSPGDQCVLEVVIYDGEIRCWVRGGRFRGRHWLQESEPEHQYISLPMYDQRSIAEFLRPDDPSTIEPPYRYDSQPWDREFAKQEGDLKWFLRIVNNEARRIE